MIRAFLALTILCGIAGAQVNVPAPSDASVPPVTKPGAVSIDVPPLAPPDLLSPYASPRDMARHRLQATLAELQSKRDVHAAVRGFADAFAADSTYAAAAFNLAVVAAISERWEDAIAAFTEAARLDAVTLGAQANSQLERLRLLATLETSPEGKRRRKYDEALLPLLAKLPKMPLAEAMAALGEVGRIDSKRWESPALLASLLGNGRSYDEAAKFLETAVGNATDPAVKASLQKAFNAAERERRYAAARAAAEAAADGGDHAKAAQLFETAWTAIPARSANGLSAVSEVLLRDDTARAAALLARLRAGGDSNLAEVAAAMLKQLEPIEPAAKDAKGDGAEFFRDSGSPEPVRIATLVPPIDRTEMELLARPLPKLIQDSEPVVLLATLSAENSDLQQAALPVLPEPGITFENAWKDVLRERQKSALNAPVLASQRDLETVDLSKHPKLARLLKLTSEPAGAKILLDDRGDEICQTPCDVRVEAGPHTARFSMPGYQDEERTVNVAAKVAELSVPLSPARGSVLIETERPAALKVNGTPVNATAPAELSLLPGLYRITADFGSSGVERMLTVRSGAHLRLRFKQ